MKRLLLPPPHPPLDCLPSPPAALPALVLFLTWCCYYACLILPLLPSPLLQVRADADAMRADNLALVERLKFVQGYQAGGSSSGGGGGRRSAAGGSGGPASASADLEAGAVVGKYMQQYEQSINPFAGEIWQLRCCGCFALDCLLQSG